MTDGHAYGAVTVLNATATGHGASLAVRDGVTANWTWTDADFDWRGPTDDRLARAVFELLRERVGRTGAVVDTTYPWPPARGLKTSSGAATALVRAALADAGLEADDPGVESLAVQASRAAGVTLTGAYDDQVATVRGGCHLTDNTAQTILQEVPVAPWHVAVWVPDAHIPKERLRDVDARLLAPRIQEAERLLVHGDVPSALTHNGALFLGFYESLGLPVDARPVHVALEAGALGAGLSGTGPAVAALFQNPVFLHPVPGGAWKWTQVQGVQR